MRLLVVSAFFEGHRGGIEIVAGQLARQFQQAGHDVTWLASDAPADACERTVSIRAFNGIERALGVPFPLPAPSAFAAIYREIRRADVVLLHEALYPANIVAFLLARWLAKPVIITQHIGCVPYRNPLMRGLMWLLTRVAARPILAAADQVVFISRITERAFADVRFRRPPRVIFNGIDTDTFRPANTAAEKMEARRQLGLPADRPVALFVGRFVEKKGLHVLQRAAARGQDMVFALAGWGHVDPGQWGLSNVHVFSGLSQASLVPLYQASDVFVLPSVGEGFPLVLQEALACGLPAVCGEETAQADDRVQGLLNAIAIDEHDADNTARHLVHAARAAVAADSSEKAARRSTHMRAWYSWSRAAELYSDLVAELSAGKNMIADGSASQVLPATGGG